MGIFLKYRTFLLVNLALEYQGFHKGKRVSKINKETLKARTSRVVQKKVKKMRMEIRPVKEVADDVCITMGLYCPIILEDLGR